MNAMTHQVAIKWLEHAGQQAPLWLIAQHERECCTCVEPGEQCERAARCSQREHCPTLHYAAMHCGSSVPRAALEHVIDGRVAVIRTESVSWEARQ